MSLKGFLAFVNKKGAFGSVDARADATDKESLNPAEWWQLNGEEHMMIQKVAMRVLSQTTCASSCERNWSCQKFVQSGSESLHPKNLDKRVYTYANIRLEKKMSFACMDDYSNFEEPVESDDDDNDGDDDAE